MTPIGMVTPSTPAPATSAPVGVCAPIPAHINDLLHREPNSGCWLWAGPRSNTGYGTVSFEGRTRLVHRIVVELTSGPIQSGLQVDHLCGVRLCANPDHLRVVVPRTNSMATSSAIAARFRSRVCRNGHEYTPANTEWVDRGEGVRHRRCRTCIRNKCREVGNYTRQLGPKVPIADRLYVTGSGHYVLRLRCGHMVSRKGSQGECLRLTTAHCERCDAIGSPIDPMYDEESDAFRLCGARRRGESLHECCLTSGHDGAHTCHCRSHWGDEECAA